MSLELFYSVPIEERNLTYYQILHNTEYTFLWFLNQHNGIEYHEIRHCHFCHLKRVYNLICEFVSRENGILSIILYTEVNPFIDAANVPNKLREIGDEYFTIMISTNFCTFNGASCHFTLYLRNKP